MTLIIVKEIKVFQFDLDHQAGVMYAIHTFVDVCLNLDMPNGAFIFNLERLWSAFEVFKQEVSALLKKHNSEQTLTHLKHELAKAEKIRNNILEAIKQGILTASTKEELEKAENRITELQKAMDEIKGFNPASLVTRICERYLEAVDCLENEILDMDIETTRNAIRPFIGDKIRIHRGDQHLNAEIVHNMVEVVANVVAEDGTPHEMTIMFRHDSKILQEIIKESSIPVVAGGGFGTNRTLVPLIALARRK